MHSKYFILLIQRFFFSPLYSSSLANVCIAILEQSFGSNRNESQQLYIVEGFKQEQEM